MTQQTYSEPHLGKMEIPQLNDAEEDTRALNSFFKDAAQALEKLGFYLGPIRYSVQHRTYHDQQHNGHGDWTFACLRRERYHYLIVPDRRYVLALELDNLDKKGRSFNFTVYTRTHFNQIKEALKPLSDRLSSETRRNCVFHHSLPEEVPDILAC